MTAIERRRRAGLRPGGVPVHRGVRAIERSRPSLSASPRSVSACSGEGGSRGCSIDSLPREPQLSTPAYQGGRSAIRTSASPMILAYVRHHDAIRSCSCCSTPSSRSSRSPAFCSRSARCCSARGRQLCAARLACRLSALGKPLVRMNYDQSDLRRQPARRMGPRSRECGVDRDRARRAAAARAAAPAPEDDVMENLKHIIRVNRNLGYFHHRLQLHGPDHSGPAGGAALHPRARRVRRHLAVGHGVHTLTRRVFADRHAVSIHLVVRGRARASQLAGRGARRDGRARTFPGSDGGDARPCRISRTSRCVRRPTGGPW